MSLTRWKPPVELTKKEQFVLQRLQKTRKLFAWLRLHRHELFDDVFQDELAAMYRVGGGGTPPKPPAQVAMLYLLQGYLQVSDAEAIELTMLDLRWQLVLDCMGAQTPLCAQSVLVDFRARLLAHNMTARWIERSVELAKQHPGADARVLSKALRVAVDSRPLEGAGRVQDTLNLLGHAARVVVSLAARELGITTELAAKQARIPLLLASSLKAGLDLNWSAPSARAQALQILLPQLRSLRRWIRRQLPTQSTDPSHPLSLALATLQRIEEQDLEHLDDGTVRIREGVAADRQISISDPEMRHGRKSNTRVFHGFKEHIAVAMDAQLTLAAKVTPGNQSDAHALQPLLESIEEQQLAVRSVHFDRGYLGSSCVPALQAAGVAIVCRPWSAWRRSEGVYAKADFTIDLQRKRVTCPAGQSRPIKLGQLVRFSPKQCAVCPQRSQCTNAALSKGRSLLIAEDEPLQVHLRAQQTTRAGRKALRERVCVEHRLAHLSHRKGKRARYLGVAKNELDLCRNAMLSNLETIQRQQMHRLANAA